jgi:hypothetical protein
MRRTHQVFLVVQDHQSHFASSSLAITVTPPQSVGEIRLPAATPF